MNLKFRIIGVSLLFTFLTFLIQALILGVQTSFSTDEFTRISFNSLIVFLLSLLIQLVLVAISILEKIKGGLQKVNQKTLTQEQFIKHQKNTRRDQIRELSNLFYQIESTIQLESIYKYEYRMPPSRSWAASPDLILEIVSQIRNRKPLLVVELGSGLSTIWIARALRENGIGKLITFDHDSKYGEQTRAQLQLQELDSFVELRFGELEESSWQDNTQRWYPRHLFSDLQNLDLLVVDGPPQTKNQNHRWPAMWELESKMNSSSIIILDDAFREEESALANAWSQLGNYFLEIKAFEKGAAVMTRMSKL